MATLTPLAKGLIGLTVVGAVASSVWHLALRDKISEPAAVATVVAAQPATPAVAVPAPVATVPQATPPVQASSKPPAASAEAEDADALSPAENGDKGRRLMSSGNHADARPFLERAVAGGDGAAACLLGEMTLNGLGGIAADRDKAARLFQIAQSKNIICFASGR